jgi:HEAT repeat protein
MKKLLVCLGAVSLVSLLYGLDAFGHGGQYRGPSGQVPPTGRTPNDPTPPPTPGGGTTGGGPTTGGSTPTPGAVPTGGGPVGPRGGISPRGATGGRGGGRRAAAEGYERWEFWWEYNKEPFLNLKQRIGRGNSVPSGSSDFFLGSNPKGDASNTVKVTGRQISEVLIPGLLEACNDKFFDVRAAAVIGLGKTRDKTVVPTIMKLLADEDKQVRESAALALGILGDKDSIQPLLALMQETAEGKKLAGGGLLTRTRAFAAIGLGLVKDESVIQPLLAQITADEKQKDVPICAAVALGIMGETAKPALPELVKIAQNKKTDDFLRGHVVSALGKIGDPSVIPFLQGFLDDDSQHVARSAVQGLGLLSNSEDTKSISLLIDVIEKGRDVQAKNWALISLGKIGGVTARKAMLTALEKEQQSTKAFAALGLAIMGNKSKDSQDGKYIQEVLNDTKDPSVKGAMAIALGILEFKAAESDLKGVLTSTGSTDLRGYAAVSLGLMRSTLATQAIKDVLNEKGDPDLQRSAATGLGLMGDKDAVPLLVKIMKTASTEFVISSAALALGFIGEASAVPELLAFVKDTKTADLARANATSALGVIGDARDLPPLSVVSVDVNYRALVDALQELLSLV